MRRFLLAIVAAATVFLLGACSNNSADGSGVEQGQATATPTPAERTGRPTQKELATAWKIAVQNGAIPDKLNDEQIDCVTGVLHDSSISDEMLNSMLDGNADYEISAEDQAVIDSLGPQVQPCLPADVAVPTETAPAS